MPDVLTPANRPGDFDMIEEIRKILALYEVPENKIETNFLNDYWIKLAENKPPHIQLFFVNRYWALQLMHTQKNTTDLRLYLIKDNPDLWLEYFKTYVARFAVLNDLPAAISL